MQLLDLLTAINRQFATEVRVSTLQVESAREAGHDFEGVEQLSHDRFTELEHLEVALAALGNEVWQEYQSKAMPLLAEYLDVVANGTSAEEWSELVDRGRDVVTALAGAVRIELGVPAR